MMESIVSYVFDDLEFVTKNLWLLAKHESEMRGHFMTGFFQTWLAIFHYECFKLTRKRTHKRLARRSHQRVHHWSTTGTDMLLGPNLFLNAMRNICVKKSPLQENFEISFRDAAVMCNKSHCRLFEALAYERLAKVLHAHEPEGVRHRLYQHRSAELYKSWGAFEKAYHVERKFDMKMNESLV
jgi:hypothetical protein